MPVTLWTFQHLDPFVLGKGHFKSSKASSLKVQCAASLNRSLLLGCPFYSPPETFLLADWGMRKPGLITTTRGKSWNVNAFPRSKHSSAIYNHAQLWRSGQSHFLGACNEGTCLRKITLLCHLPHLVKILNPGTHLGPGTQRRNLHAVCFEEGALWKGQML